MNENTSNNLISSQEEKREAPLDSGTENESGPASPPVSRSNTVFSVTALAIALAIAGCGLWIWLKTYHDLATVQDSVQRLHKRIEKLDLKPELNTAINRFETEKAILSNNIEEQNHVIESLRQSLSKLFAVSAQTPREWNIVRSLHLLEQANYSLQFLRDVDTAVMALQAAYRIIKESADPALLHSREVISVDLNKLKNFKQPHLNGIEDKLDQMLKGHRYALSVKPDTSKGDRIPPQKNSHSHSDEQDSQNILYTLLQEVNKHLVVKRHDKPIEALPSQRTQIYYYQILHLKLESIRAALLRKDNKQYQRQINSTVDWIGSHYTPSSVKEIKEELENLATINIAPPLPTITDSIEVLKAALDTTAFHVKEGAMK